jgi:hypothetical protein
MNLPFDYADESDAALTGAVGRKCHRHSWALDWYLPDDADPSERSLSARAVCRKCRAVRDDARSRTGRNNRKRGNAAELDVARLLGGNKMGPLGLPWDVEMPGYARLQVRKLANPPSLRKVIVALNAIGASDAMPGYIWVEPGRGGERLIVLRLADFAERHGR